MGFRYRRRVKIFPGIFLNLTGRNFLSSLTFHSDHTHVNIPIQRSGPATTTVGNFGGPLTGLSYRETWGNRSTRRSNDIDPSALRAALADDQKRRMDELLKAQQKQKDAKQ